MMVAARNGSFSDGYPGVVDRAAGMAPSGLLKSVTALAAADVDFFGTPPFALGPPPIAPPASPDAVATSTPPKGPGLRVRRLRKAPDRLISLAQARLAAGRDVVPAEGNFSRWYRRMKRALDVAGALGLLLALWPVMLGAYVVLLVTTRGRPIFRQVRLGYRGRPFTLYKFRTMVLDAIQRQRDVANEKDGPIFKNRRDPRVTRLGRLLRSFSVDELPQLFNVLRGQMSLVGPRPPLAAEVAGYEPWQRRRLAVKPGLTCLWQISGRSEIGFRQWVRMDLWYVRNQSLRTDLKLLAKTPWSVLSRRGAY
jgi:lipopolysaccharide/colanic/teichoic acid biosynthesis glycosyltransferase